MPDDGRVVIDLTGDDDDAPVFSPPPARAPPAKFRMLYVEPVLARYEGELHFPARRLYSYQSTCVEFVNGERRELEKDDVVNRSDPRFQRVKLGKLPMAAPGDTRSLEERRAAGGYDAPAIPNLAERLRLTLPLLKRIALGEEGHLWRFQDFKKGTVAASKRCLNGSVGGFFDGNEMMEIALWVSENTRNFETVAENETLRRRLLVDVLIPEAMIELIRSYKNVTYDKAEELFYVGDKKRRNSQIHKYSREELVRKFRARKRTKPIAMENVGRPVLDSLPVAPAAPLRPVPFAANDPPQEIQQLHALVEQFRRNHNFQAVLTVAMMYQRGAYPRLRPNDVLASELCLAVATHPAAPRDVGNQAARLYMEVFASPVLADDRAGEEMPTGPARTMLRLLGDMQPIVPDETYPMLNGMLNMDHEIALALAMEGDGNGDDPFAVPDLHSQNSHDHGVVRAVQSTLMALPTFDGDDHHVVRQVRDQISAQRELSNAERRDAAKVLDAVRANPKDVEALGKVWQRIQDEPDPEVRSNRIETLGKQLASGVEDGHVVCSTGRISRMVAALQGQDEPDDAVVRIRSTNNVAQELMQMAAYVRDQVLTDASHVDRMDYGTGAGQTQFLSDEMAKRFREKVNATYVQEMGMSPAVLEPILEPLIASF